MGFQKYLPTPIKNCLVICNSAIYNKYYVKVNSPNIFIKIYLHIHSTYCMLLNHKKKPRKSYICLTNIDRNYFVEKLATKYDKGDIFLFTHSNYG